MPVARDLAAWAHDFVADADDLALARRSLVDTVAVTLAARAEPMANLARPLGEAGRWAAIGHVLDFDDLHMASTAHISVVCVPTTLAAGGTASDFLAAAGVMARLGAALGWSHYSLGWHATSTSGAIASAVAAGRAAGLDADRIATAMALAVGSAGGVQRAFGSDGKALQVGGAVATGLRAARLAAAGARADLDALDDWLALVGGSADKVDVGGPAVPGGLAVKIFPCCYALQRPISALATMRGVDVRDVRRIVLRTPESTVAPLLHHRPTTGLQGKFSLEYAAAVALLDDYAGFASFTDEAVRRPEAQRLLQLVDVELEPGGEGLLDGEFRALIELGDGGRREASLRLPPGSPQRPPSENVLAGKVADCLRGVDTDPAHWNFETARALLRAVLGPSNESDGSTT